MSKRLVIIGASAMGREACHYARMCGYEVVGFVDSRAHILDGYQGYPPILGPAESFSCPKDVMLICAVGEPEVKRRYVEIFPTAQWATIIHPLAYVGENVRIGRGCIICPHATLTCDLTLGDHVIVNVNASVSHDCRVGDFVSLSPGCNIAGWCRLGDEVFAGVQSSVIPHVTIGDRVFVAAGTVVIESTNGPRVMGVPGMVK